jgi:hypothetical protein
MDINSPLDLAPSTYELESFPRSAYRARRHVMAQLDFYGRRPLLIKGFSAKLPALSF